MDEELYDVIWEVVVDHLSEWGTTAQVVEQGRENKPLRDVLNSLVQPLIDELHEKVSKFYKEKENERS